MGETAEGLPPPPAPHRGAGFPIMYIVGTRPGIESHTPIHGRAVGQGRLS